MSARPPAPHLQRLVDDYIDEFCQRFDVSRVDLRRPRGPADIVELRDQLTLELYDRYPLTTPNIAWFLDRDHSSICIALQRARERKRAA